MNRCSCGTWYGDEEIHHCKYDNVIQEHVDIEHVKEEVGLKFDGEKLRYDLEPIKATDEMIKVLTFGAQKYAPENWRKVDDPMNRYYAALRRHLHAWRSGEIYDPESGHTHLGHAMCCLAFLTELEQEDLQRIEQLTR